MKKTCDKIQYRSVAKARQALRECRTLTPRPLAFYWCKACKAYNLTSQADAERKRFA